MTITVTFTTGIGKTCQYPMSYDTDAAFSLVGLTTEDGVLYYAVITSLDGQTAMTDRESVTFTDSIGTTSFNLNNDVVAAIYEEGRTKKYPCLLTVYSASFDIIGICELQMIPGASQDAGTVTVGVNYATEDDIDELQAQIDAFIFSSVGDTDTIDLTITDGELTADVVDNSISNSKLATMANSTIKGRSTAGTGDPEDLTDTQIRSIINVEDGAEVNNISDTDATDLTDGGETSLHSHNIDEAAQDAVGGILTDTTEIDFTYDDTSPSITAQIKTASVAETKLTAELSAKIQKTVSALPTSSIENNKIYYLDTTDTTSKAAKGFYVYDGTAWFCIKQFAVYDLGNLTGAVTVPSILDADYIATTIGDTVWTFPAGAGCISIRLTNGGSQLQTWDANINWPGGSSPSLASSGVDWIVFVSADGTNWDGALSMGDMS